MISRPETRISEKALKVWRISNGIIAACAWSVLVTVASLFFIFDWPLWILALLVLLELIHTILSVIVFPGIRWRRWRYEVREQEIELQQGLFVVQRTLIPMVRVQHVDTFQGPILRKYNLATVMISTAATTHEIPALEEAEAEGLRVQISRLARVTDDDV
ncbi:hypothetical protein A8F94_23635 [Bacillus sp. FJAT-27225]|uniref:PH domain-containing protein n=1 Tax=Bacillus sp. FJAT-27225 TaxID=1743144 RepID=UPI00080C2270|nr:PH domain-containing protein [Bacillus sp. FJAT-27225]OCA89346.1 hypothetical protein A8F94_23635 [Bacillus sp. FJAT-27225]